MKLPPVLPRPSRADRTRLPAALVLLLLLALAAQLMMPAAVALPEPVPGRPLRLPPLVILPTGADAVLAQRPLFSPSRRPGIAGAAGDQSGGLRAVGTVTRRGTVRLFVQSGDGRVEALGIGGSVDGWRLDAVAADAARFSRGDARITLPIGANAPPRAPRADPASEATAEEVTP